MATPNDTTLTKVCSKCKRELPATAEYFYKHIRMKDGLSRLCKPCHNQNVSEYRSRNPDKVKKWNEARDSQKHREYMRQRYQQKKDYIISKIKEWQEKNPDKVQQYKTKHYSQNRERYNEASRQKYRNNPEHRAIHYMRTRRWQKNNPEATSLIRRRRYARATGAEGTYTTEDIYQLHEQQQERCGYCGITLHDDWEIDHIMPLSKGGTNYPDNLILACVPCNRSKNDKVLDEWIKLRGW